MLGPNTWIGRLTPAENLMEENPEGPDVRLDGVMPSGERLWGSPLIRDVVVIGEIDVLLQSDTCWGWPRGRPCSRDRPEEPGMWWATVQSGPTPCHGFLGAELADRA